MGNFIKLLQVKTYYKALICKLKKYGIFSETISIDEQTVIFWTANFHRG